MQNTALGTANAGRAYAMLGNLAGADSVTGMPGAIIAFLPSYAGEYFKQVVALTRSKSNATEVVALAAGVWGSIVPVQSIQIFAESGSIAAGFNLSIFGMK